jgi:aspartyl-tRNA synthetase
LAKNGVIKGLGVEQAGEMSRAQIDKLVEIAKKGGAKGLVWIKGDVNGVLTSAVSKALPEEKVKELHKALCPSGKGLSLIVADTFDTACSALSALRLHFGRELKLIDESQDKFLWVVDFPLFEYDAEGGRWNARHHPFTSPQNQHMDILKKRGRKNATAKYWPKPMTLFVMVMKLVGVRFEFTEVISRHRCSKLSACRSKKRKRSLASSWRPSLTELLRTRGSLGASTD